MKTFYNTKKVFIIPPILTENKLEADFFERVNYFSNFFDSKCTPLSNSSSSPSSLNLETEDRLTSINLSDNDTLKIIRSLDINKTHGHDDIFVRMVKVYDDAMKKPLSIIYKIVLKQVYIFLHGKSVTLSQSTRKEISKLLTITNLFHFF